LASTSTSRTSAPSGQAWLLRGGAAAFSREATSRAWPIRSNHFESRRESAGQTSRVRSRRDRGVGGEHGNADTMRLGITGFCWAAGRSGCMRSQSIFESGSRMYGPLQMPPRSSGQKIRLIWSIRSMRRFWSVCGKDMAIPVAQIEQLRAALKAGANLQRS